MNLILLLLGIPFMVFLSKLGANPVVAFFGGLFLMGFTFAVVKALAKKGIETGVRAAQGNKYIEVPGYGGLVAVTWNNKLALPGVDKDDFDKIMDQVYYLLGCNLISKQTGDKLIGALLEAPIAPPRHARDKYLQDRLAKLKTQKFDANKAKLSLIELSEHTLLEEKVYEGALEKLDMKVAEMERKAREKAAEEAAEAAKKTAVSADDDEDEWENFEADLEQAIKDIKDKESGVVREEVDQAVDISKGGPRELLMANYHLANLGFLADETAERIEKEVRAMAVAKGDRIVGYGWVKKTPLEYGKTTGASFTALEDAELLTREEARSINNDMNAMRDLCDDIKDPAKVAIALAQVNAQRVAQPA
jgi:hypothetical protein